MDHPIIYANGKRSPKSVPEPDKSRLDRRLNVALANDEKADFMSLIKDPGFEQVRNSFTAYKIISYDALEIAMAVLHGETKGLIDMEDELKDGITFLHLATIHSAPRLTEYLLQNGYKVDAVCDVKKFNLENVSPIGLCTCTITIGEIETIFELLFHICYHNRRRLEVIRMLVQREQHTWAREAFLNYAQNGELPELAALFLATPDLFMKSLESGELSLLSKLENKLNSMEHKTHIENQLLLLLDVFALVGHKLAAYTRLEEFAPKSYTTEEIELSMLEIESFLREAATLKHGDHYVDYYLRFFEDGKQNSDPDDPPGDGDGDGDEDDDEDEVRQAWDKWTARLVGNDVLYFLPYLLRRSGFKRPEIHRLIPTLDAQDADILTEAIENKLSSMSAF